MNLKNCIIESVSTRKDRSLKIILGTLEISPEQTQEIFANVHHSVDDINIPDAQNDDGRKSPSQRLRNVLYIYWQQNYKKEFITFALFYSNYMEKLINAYKEKLE